MSPENPISGKTIWCTCCTHFHTSVMYCFIQQCCTGQFPVDQWRCSKNSGGISEIKTPQSSKLFSKMCHIFFPWYPAGTHQIPRYHWKKNLNKKSSIFTPSNALSHGHYQNQAQLSSASHGPLFPIMPATWGVTLTHKEAYTDFCSVVGQVLYKRQKAIFLWSGALPDLGPHKAPPRTGPYSSKSPQPQALACP